MPENLDDTCTLVDYENQFYKTILYYGNLLHITY